MAPRFSHGAVAAGLSSLDAAGGGGGGGGGGGTDGTLKALLDIDFTTIGSYDFLADGPAGDGTHTFGGYTWEVTGSSNCTTLEISASGFTLVQTTGGAVEVGIDLIALSGALDPAGPAHALTRAASAVSTGAGDGLQCGIHRTASLGTWATGDCVTRYRKADATPDFYAITYNGSSWDALAGGTVTASGDVRMQCGVGASTSAVLRGDTGTATDPADWDVLPEFAAVNYALALSSFTGTYPGSSNCWVWLGGAGACSGVFKKWTAYGLEA